MRDEPPRHYQGIAAYGTPWWTTATMLHVRLWREHGWRAYPDRTLRAVRFVRDAEEGRSDA